MPEAASRYVLKDFSYSSHRILLAMVGEAPQVVLEVGTASGFLGAILTRAGHRVVGVEIDGEAAARARGSYAAFHVADAQDLPPLPEAPFDVALLGDVLEHLGDPARALAGVARQVRPGGRLLISVPNVAFLAVRLSLLAGRFTYRSRGILDRSHLRFFTRRSLLALLRAEGLEVLRLKGVPPPLLLAAPWLTRLPGSGILSAAAALSARLWPALLAYQLVAEVRR